jgi:hypothetical protein
MLDRSILHPLNVSHVVDVTVSIDQVFGYVDLVA